jgi:trans-aconitate methyltransferase
MLANLAAGIVDRVFEPVIDALTALPLERFSLLDAGCATGYYSEVIRSRVPKDVWYRGCDFSEAMVEQARALSRPAVRRRGSDAPGIRRRELTWCCSPVCWSTSRISKR